MIDKGKTLLEKYEEIITYLIVGVLTTIVSWVTCWVFETTLFDSQVGWESAVINTVGWVAGILFGYVTNRRFVFKSTNPNIIQEFSRLAGTRVSTLILDIVIMYVTVNMMQMNYWLAKVFISSFLVMIANYVFSKFFVFRKEEDIEKFKVFLKKYEEIITYLIIGILTTLVSWITCWLFEITLFNPQIGWQNIVINTLGWGTGVLFGYVTNRKYVFKSNNPKIMKEFIQFSGSRISTLLLDNVIMYVTATLIGMNWWTAKIFISSVLVMITNYVFSKLFVFNKNKTVEQSI